MRAARLARFAGGTKPAAMSVNTNPPNVSNLDNTSKDARDKVNSPTATGDADDGLSILISMGFDKEKSTQMLEITAGDVEQAVALLTSQWIYCTVINITRSIYIYINIYKYDMRR